MPPQTSIRPIHNPTLEIIHTATEICPHLSPLLNFRLTILFNLFSDVIRICPWQFALVERLCQGFFCYSHRQGRENDQDLLRGQRWGTFGPLYGFQSGNWIKLNFDHCFLNFTSKQYMSLPNYLYFSNKLKVLCTSKKSYL